MTETLQRMMELKKEADQLIKTVNEDTRNAALALQKTRTEQLQYAIAKLDEFTPIIKEYRLQYKDGWDGYKILTEIPSKVYPDMKLEVTLCPGRDIFKLCGYKIDNEGLIEKRGYDYKTHFRLDEFAVFPSTERGEMSVFAREIEAFINGIDYYLPEIERLIMKDCQIVLLSMMEEANRNNERVKAEF